MAMKHLANIEKSRKEYHALPDSEWRKDYFDENTGGYLVTSWKRLEEAGKNHNEQQKFDKEHGICLVFVKSGLKIQHLEDNKPDGTYDIVCNGRSGDLKRTKGSGNIVRYAKYATKEQGAEIVLFEFDEWKNEIRDAVSELIRKNLHGYYYVSGELVVHSF